MTAQAHYLDGDAGDEDGGRDEEGDGVAASTHRWLMGLRGRLILRFKAGLAPMNADDSR